MTRLEANKERCAAYYIANKEKIKLRHRLYRKSHQKSIAEYDKRWREENIDKKVAYNRHWYEENKEMVAEYYKRWRELNYDPDKQREAQWRCDIRLAERQFEEAKAWTEAHPEAMARCPL